MAAAPERAAGDGAQRGMAARDGTTPHCAVTASQMKDCWTSRASIATGGLAWERPAKVLAVLEGRGRSAPGCFAQRSRAGPPSPVASGARGRGQPLLLRLLLLLLYRGGLARRRR